MVRTAILTLSMACLCQAVTLQNSPPINTSGRNDLVYSGLKIASTGTDPCIFVVGSRNVVIENCWFGPCGGEGVKMYQASNVTVRNCYFERVNSGVYAIECQKVVVDNNNFLNIQGKRNVAMFNRCTGGGLRITNNRAENIEGSSSTEDLVNLYGTVGLASDPVIVSGNRFRGGGPSQTGGGLMSGDNGGAYYIVRDNILVNPGNYGIAIAGGHDIQLLNNTIYQESKAWSHFPAYIWDWESRGNCYGHVIRGNKSTFYNNNGQLASLWYGHNTICTWTDISANNWNAGLTSSVLPAKLWTSEIPAPTGTLTGHSGDKRRPLEAPRARACGLGGAGRTVFDLRGVRASAAGAARISQVLVTGRTCGCAGAMVFAFHR